MHERAERAARLAEVRARALQCRRCHLWTTRTRVVFGEGDFSSPLMLVGEGPGETEDRQGRPFVGRAGALLDRGLAAAGLGRDRVWITNLVRSRPVAVQADGTLRNRAPLAGEVAACRVWMQAELDLVRPRVLVCLGAVPARYLIGRDFRLTEARGQLVEVEGTLRTASFHPAYLLRLTAAARAAAFAALVADLRAAARAAGAPG